MLSVLCKKPGEAAVVGADPGRSDGISRESECNTRNSVQPLLFLPFLSWPPSPDFAPVFPSKRQGASL
jgi:hypothetical protein